MDANGCLETNTIEVETIPPLEMEAFVPEIPCDFSTVRLTLENLSGDPSPINYLWANGSVQDFINVDTPGLYTVTLSNVCETMNLEFNVPLAADARRNFFYIPNVFSPNEDGLNDVWRILPADDVEVLSFELHVFNRWGDHLKQVMDVYDFWDGSFKNKNLNPGVYVYYAEVVFLDGTVERYVGDVTLVK